jgi:hypothetical protein
MMTPPIATASAAAMQNTAAVPAFTSRRRDLPAGRASRYRNVPRLPSPATVSPDTTEMVRGRKNGTVTVRPANAAKTPL